MNAAGQTPGTDKVPKPGSLATRATERQKLAPRPSLWEALWRRVRRNLGLKILSLLIAMGLWASVNAGQPSAIESMQVPVSYHGLARGLVIVNHPIDFVKIQVTGPRAMLSLLDPERLTVKLDLSSIGAGQSSFKITPAMFDVPRGTNVASVSPSDVMLDVDRIVRRDVPVRVTLQGKVANGYMVQAVKVEPPSVRVIGPSRYVDPLDAIQAEPIDVTGISSDIYRAVELKSPKEVVLSIVRVQADVIVTQKVADRDFKNIQLQVKNSDYKYRLVPLTGTVTLRGPVLQLADLNSDGLLYVEAKDLGPGVHSVAVQVNVPDGLKLVRQSPDTVKLRLYREKISRK